MICNRIVGLIYANRYGLMIDITWYSSTVQWMQRKFYGQKRSYIWDFLIKTINSLSLFYADQSISLEFKRLYSLVYKLLDEETRVVHIRTRSRSCSCSQLHVYVSLSFLSFPYFLISVAFRVVSDGYKYEYFTGANKVYIVMNNMRSSQKAAECPLFAYWHMIMLIWG